LDTEQDLEMAGNSTLTIIKPDAFGSGKAGKIIAHLEQQGFRVLASRVMRLARRRPANSMLCTASARSNGSLVSFMTSGPCMPMVLEKADAVAALRTAIGATDPAQADAGTVRKLFAESKERNAIHASDSDENAVREARFFFAESEILAGR
jgi:nucleoside-diphosphate kinase